MKLSVLWLHRVSLQCVISRCITLTIFQGEHMSQRLVANGLASVFMVAALPVFANALMVDLGVRGSLRYCQYSNQKIYTLSASDPCPPSVADRPAGNGRGTGLLRGESPDGDSKLCSYNVNGVERTLRIDNTATCPINQSF